MCLVFVFRPRVFGGCPPYYGSGVNSHTKSMSCALTNRGRGSATLLSKRDNHDVCKTQLEAQSLLEHVRARRPELRISRRQKHWSKSHISTIKNCRSTLYSVQRNDICITCKKRSPDKPPIGPSTLPKPAASRTGAPSARRSQSPPDLPHFGVHKYCPADVNLAAAKCP